MKKKLLIIFLMVLFIILGITYVKKNKYKIQLYDIINTNIFDKILQIDNTITFESNDVLKDIKLDVSFTTDFNLSKNTIFSNNEELLTFALYYNKNLYLNLFDIYDKSIEFDIDYKEDLKDNIKVLLNALLNTFNNSDTIFDKKNNKTMLYINHDNKNKLINNFIKYLKDNNFKCNYERLEQYLDNILNDIKVEIYVSNTNDLEKIYIFDVNNEIFSLNKKSDNNYSIKIKNVNMIININSFIKNDVNIFMPNKNIIKYENINLFDKFIIYNNIENFDKIETLIKEIKKIAF